MLIIFPWVSDSFNTDGSVYSSESKIEHNHLMELVGQLSHVRSLELRPPRRSDLRVLESFEELRSLHLGRSSSLAGIEHCKQLERLSLSKGNIKTLEPLRGMSNLSHVSLSLNLYNPLKFDPEVVATWTNLRQFRIYYCDSVDLAGFENLPDLEVLVVSGLLQSEIKPSSRKSLVTGLESLKNMRSLKHLSLPNCASLESLDFCRELADLEELDLSGCKSLKNIDGVSQLTKLKKIRLRQCPHLEDLSGLESISSLKELTIHSDPLGLIQKLWKRDSIVRAQLITEFDKLQTERKKQVQALTNALPGVKINTSVPVWPTGALGEMN